MRAWYTLRLSRDALKQLSEQSGLVRANVLWSIEWLIGQACKLNLVFGFVPRST